MIGTVTGIATGTETGITAATAIGIVTGIVIGTPIGPNDPSHLINPSHPISHPRRRVSRSRPGSSELAPLSAPSVAAPLGFPTRP